jgi:hypothetical protein
VILGFHQLFNLFRFYNLQFVDPFIESVKYLMVLNIRRIIQNTKSLSFVYDYSISIYCCVLVFIAQKYMTKIKIYVYLYDEKMAIIYFYNTIKKYLIK